MNDLALLVTGLPGSGKSTIGRKLAEEMSYPYLDKDDFLEALFEREGVGDRNWRRCLSIKADKHFERAAIELNSVVLVSHWRPSGATNTGTPTSWLNNHFSKVIEIFCDCPPDVAATRFVARRRHIGHLDSERSYEEVFEWMKSLADSYPIHLGPVITTSTNGHLSATHLASTLETLLS